MARKRRKLPTFLHTPVYVAIRAMLATMLTGDMRSNLRTARACARLYSKFEPRRMQRTIDTLGVAIPDMPLEQRRASALQAYEHLFMLGVEMAHTPRMVTTDTWPEHIQLVDLEPAARLLVSGRPCVMITGHCGNWELLGYTMALLGFPMYALYRPLDLKPMDQWVRQTREKRGLMLLDKYGATQVMPELMRDGKLVAFIADQNAGEKGLYVPFFNRLASTYKSIGLMAMQFDAPIICGQARRLVSFRDADGIPHPPEDIGGGFKTFDPTNPLQYQVRTLDIIMPEEWKNQPDPLFYISARYRRAIERMVRAAPEQNLWLHRYWKSRPRHEQMGRPFPASLRAKLRNLPWMTDDELARIEDWSKRDAAEWAKRPPKPSLVPVAAPTE